MRLWTACKMTLVLTFLLGIVYPVAMTVFARIVFPFQAEGSLIARDGQIVGSELIGQNFALPAYFHDRPSAAGDKGYDATSSSGSNLSLTNKSFIDTVKQRVKDVVDKNPGVTPAQIPVDLVTASGSGLDPEISPAAAELQVPRVAKARGLSEETVRSLVSANSRARWAGILGEPGVNVLELNLALDEIGKGPATASH
jgi:potassium-transporting ATPase KdpC subunit